MTPGAAGALACPVCATPTVPGARFCHHCGAPLLDRAPTDLAAERRVVTVLFGDLTDFTGWAEDLDPERVGLVIDRLLATLSRVVSAVGGHVDKLTGDGIMAVFGAPVAHGDDVERAVRAAARMQQAVRRLLLEETGGGRRLGLRVGLNTGEVLAGVQASLAYTVVGDTVNTAARLSDAAGVGAVYAGRDTALATQHIASWRPLPALRLKGKREPVSAYELVALRAAPTGRLGFGDEAAFVGREAELGRLVGRFVTTVESGTPTVTLLTGEAGAGKSRLLREFARYAGDRAATRLLWAHCSPYGVERPLAPLAEWVRTAAGVGDDEVATGADVAQRVRRLGAGLEPGVVPALLGLLGLAPPERAEPERRAGAPQSGDSADPAVRALAGLLRSLAARGPLLLVLDDAHAASDALVDALGRLSAELTGPVMLVVAGRSEALEVRPGWWRLVPEPELVLLEALDQPTADRLLRAYLGADLDPAARRALVARSQGNPYFLGELVQLLIDQGRLRPDGDTWRLDADVAAEALPSGVRAAIAARIDDLDPVTKAVLRDAAVVGLRVPVAALTALGHDPEEVRRALGVLAERGLVSERADHAVAFRHSLVRDVAYRGLTKAERARRHALVAGWAPTGLTAPREDVDTFVAAHADRALKLATEMGLPVRDPAWAAGRLAVAAYTRLGEAALEQGADVAAADLLGRALRAAERVAAPGWPDGEERRLRGLRVLALARGRRLAQAEAELGDVVGAAEPAVRARGLVTLGLVRQGRGDEAGARAAYHAGLEAGRLAGAEEVVAEGLRDLGLLHYAAGRLVAAEDCFRESLELAERGGDSRATGWALQHLTWSATTRGDYRAAERGLRRARQLFTALDDRAGLSWCAASDAFLAVLQGRFAAARAVVAATIPTAEAAGERWALATALTMEAIAAAEQGALTDSDIAARRARAEYAAAGDRWGGVLAHVAGGFIARGAGDYAAAVARLEEAVTMAREPHYRVIELLAVTTLGYCHLDRGAPAAAEAAAREATALVCGLDLAPGAAVGPRVLLAQALRGRGALAEALELLAEVAGTAAEASLLFPRRQALAHYAGALLEAGDVSGAADVIRRALAVPAEDIRSQVVTLRVSANVAVADGRPADARRALLEAVRIAGATEARGELPATERALAALG